jgi:cytochrome c6
VREILLRRKNVKLLSLRLSLAILLACGVMAVCSSSAAAQDAAATYKSRCAMCHGADGKGGKMGTKDFASPDIQGMTDAQLTEVVTKGKPPKMPAYGDKLKDSDIKDLVAYIRTLGKK